MGTQAVSPYQQVIEKTKGLAFRSQMLAMNIEKKLGVRTGDVSIITGDRYLRGSNPYKAITYIEDLERVNMAHEIYKMSYRI
jgi:hypothetical protein